MQAEKIIADLGGLFRRRRVALQMVLRLHNKPAFSSPFTLVAAVDLQMKHGLARALFFQLRRELF